MTLPPSHQSYLTPSLPCGPLSTPPPEFCISVELLIKKCEIEKKTPSLKDTLKEFRSYIQKNTETLEHARALAIKQNSPRTNSPCCLNGFHKPLTKHSKSACNQLQWKNNARIVKIMVSAFTTSISEIVLDSGASASIFKSPSYFTTPSYLTTLSPTNKNVYLANGKQIKATGKGTVFLILPLMKLSLQNCLLVSSLATNLLCMGTFLQKKHTIALGGDNKFQVKNNLSNIFMAGTFHSGNFVIHQGQHAALNTSTLTPSKLMTLHEPTRHPSIDYLSRMFPRNFSKLI